ncbi:uncharacterized protein LOC123508822 [Portunus trituberculatus]|uniref:uncharacterized protein LOC123508822 n=1 Tax=Portunus trituberculatus TaxID=210409 RepID=UPI001E1D05E4|nr:uncharacterized protein LOC123508822 [Portunus trituberculatus]
MRQWLWLNQAQFQTLLDQVTPLIKKQDTNMRSSVTHAERLKLTLRYLATGETYRSLSCQFRISHNLISSIALRCAKQSTKSCNQPTSIFPRLQKNGARLQGISTHCGIFPTA